MKLKPGLEERITSHEREGPLQFHFASESNISDKEERFRKRAFLILCQPCSWRNIRKTRSRNLSDFHCCGFYHFFLPIVKRERERHFYSVCGARLRSV